MKKRLRKRLPGSLRARSGTYLPLRRTRAASPRTRTTAIPMVTSRDRLPLAFTQTTRLLRGRTHAYPVVADAQVPCLRQFCNECDFSLPAGDNQHDRQTYTQPTDGVLGGLVLQGQRRFRPAVEIQRIDHPDLLGQPSGHFAPDRRPLRREHEHLAVLELGDRRRPGRLGAVVRPRAGGGAGADQGREALHRLRPLLRAEVGRGEEAGWPRQPGFAAHQAGGDGLLPRNRGEVERVLPLAPGSLHPLALRYAAAGG